MKKNEPKAMYSMWYMGREPVEVLHYGIVYGKTYAGIRFPDGRRHSVPADELYNHQCEVHHGTEY